MRILPLIDELRNSADVNISEPFLKILSTLFQKPLESVLK